MATTKQGSDARAAACAQKYRAVNSFPYLGATWREFLERWNNPDITLPEAKGLLHYVPSLSSYYFWQNTPPLCGGDECQPGAKRRR